MRGKPYPEDIRIKAMEMLAVYSIAEVARQLNLPLTTVKTWKDGKTKGAKENAEQFAEYRTKKKTEFANKAWENIELVNDILNKRLNRALNKEQEIDELLDKALDSLSGTDYKKYSQALGKEIAKMRIDDVSKLAITLGTLYDKQALANNEATENISGNLTIEAYIDKVKGEDF